MGTLVGLGMLLLPAMNLAESVPGPRWEASVIDAGEDGYASAYEEGVMEQVIRFRLDNRYWRNIPPSRWIYADGYVATNDCSEVGLMRELVGPGGERFDVLVADCAGRDSWEWMRDNRIVAELDWDLWVLLTERYGRPLRVTLRDESESAQEAQDDIR